MSQLHLLGIRHHGPGSARHIKAVIEDICPDIVLIEGPPEGEVMLPYVIHQEMKPPVSLLAYQIDAPDMAVFYPFAVFSPEWQAMTYGIYNNIPVRFFDLPLVHKFALRAKNEPETINNSLENQVFAQNNQTDKDIFLEEKNNHPLQRIAKVAGFDNYDEWWEQTFEQNPLEGIAYFDAIREVMTTLRSEKESNDPEEKLREAFMRTNIRKAQKEGYKRIVVVCGAWHVPALLHTYLQKNDEVLVKKLPKVKVETTWIPWTNARLSFESGYGAGIHSPGWYENRWEYPNDDGTQWLANVAKIFRTEKIDVSPSHVIETQRLANNLTSLRGKSQIGLRDMNDAIKTVMGMGDETLLKLIEKKLIIGEKIGETPINIPKVPLLVDVEMSMKKLRIKPAAEKTELKLDLREENGLAKSQFLHRLNILNIAWGTIVPVRGRGTFKEEWLLEWSPEITLQIIEKAIWGNILEKAATHYIKHDILNTNHLSDLTKLLIHAIPADLTGVVDGLTGRISDLAADTADIEELMKAFEPLATITRYGNVRKTDAKTLTAINDSLVTRVCVGLPNAAGTLDDDTAINFCKILLKFKNAIELLQIKDYTKQWQEAFEKIIFAPNTHPYVAGTCCRILRDAKIIDNETMTNIFSQKMSVGELPAVAVQWLEGFLKDSAMVLILDDNIFKLLDKWVQNIDNESFMNILPLLRRTFADYTPPEKQKIGEKAKHGSSTIFKGERFVSSYNEDDAIEVITALDNIILS